MLRSSKKTLVFGLAIAVGVMGLGPGADSAGADTIVKTVSASADTYIRQNSASTNYSKYQQLTTCPTTCGSSSNSAARSLVRFSVPTIPAGSTNVSYKVKLTPTNAYTGTVTAHKVTSSYDPTTVTWKNRPSYGGILDTRSIKVSTTPMVFNVTSAVTGSGTYSFQFKQTDGGAIYFRSNENSVSSSVAPKLIVTYTEPVTSTTSTTTSTSTTSDFNVATTTTTAGPITPTTVGPVNDGPLPIVLPSQSTLKASKKKVFAHYFTPYPLSLDNQDPANDYYQRNFLSPYGENSKHIAYGGLLRDRPIPETPQSGDWILDNLKKEIRVASAAGIDGFTVDVLSVTSRNWTWTKELIQAAEETDPNFKIVLMPDMYAMNTESAGEIATAMASVAKSPAVYKLSDGRLVISPFKAEARTSTWWKGFLSTMKNTHGINVAFVPTFLNFQKYASEYAPFSYGFGNWGNRNPAHNGNLDDNITLAHSLGKIWMQPVSIQDSRPNQGIYDESNNTQNLRMTWDAAIAGADWVQLVTWNDYSEGAQFWSLHNGYTYLDISSYYLTWFKLGTKPTVTKDVVYLTHRIAPHAAVPTFDYSKKMFLRSGSSPARNTVEVLSFLKEPGTITANVGTKVYTYDAPAGMYSKVVPLELGTNKATIKRGGTTIDSVTSPWTVKSRPYVQDMQYYGVTSGR